MTPSSCSPRQQPGFTRALLNWMENLAPYGVITLNKDFEIQTWNGWMEKHAGLLADEVTGKNLFTLYPSLIERRLSGLFSRALAGEVSFFSTALHGYLLPLPPASSDASFEFMQQTARIGPLIDGGAPVGIIILIEDVTQRERQAATLRQQHERDKILSWALGHLLKTDNPRRVTRDLFLKVAEYLEFDAYLLYLLESSDNKLRLHECGGVSPELRQEIECIPPQNSGWLGSWGQRGPVVGTDVLKSTDQLMESPRRLGFEAFISHPLMAGDDCFGAVCFATRLARPVLASEVELITTLSQYLAVALSRSKAHIELKEARDKLNEHAQELEKTVAERTRTLRESIAELETFSYTVAHDLRAPIRALSGYTEVLVEDYGAGFSPEARKIVGKLSKSAKRLDDLTRDLLAFSKVSREEIKLEEVSTDDVVAEVLRISDHREANISVRYPLGYVLANPTLLEQCLMNLVDNAVKFVKPGSRASVRIWSEIASSASFHSASDSAPFTRSHYALGHSSESATGNQKFVRIFVEDEGIGISPEAQRRIFGIFERGVITNEYDGTGIGLAIVTRAVERMGGSCGVESTPGVGSRFWIELKKP